MALPSLSSVFDVARRLDRLFENVDKAQKGLEKLEARIRAVEDRMTKLEANEGNLIVEAKAAAAVAASGAVTAHLVEMSRRIGSLEERLDARRDGGQRRLE